MCGVGTLALELGRGLYCRFFSNGDDLVIVRQLRRTVAHGDIGNTLPLGKTAHIHRVVDATHSALVGVLPQCVFCIVGKHRLRLGIACNEKWVSADVRGQIFVVERCHGVNHWAALVVLLNHSGKCLKAVDNLLLSPASALLNVDKRHQILLIGLYRAGEIIKLGL